SQLFHPVSGPRSPLPDARSCHHREPAACQCASSLGNSAAADKPCTDSWVRMPLGVLSARGVRGIGSTERVTRGTGRTRGAGEIGKQRAQKAARGLKLAYRHFQTGKLLNQLIALRVHESRLAVDLVAEGLDLVLITLVNGLEPARYGVQQAVKRGA